MRTDGNRPLSVCMCCASHVRACINQGDDKTRLGLGCALSVAARAASWRLAAGRRLRWRRLRGKRTDCSRPSGHSAVGATILLQPSAGRAPCVREHVCHSHLLLALQSLLLLLRPASRPTTAQMYHVHNDVPYASSRQRSSTWPITGRPSPSQQCDIVGQKINK